MKNGGLLHSCDLAAYSVFIGWAYLEFEDDCIGLGGTAAGRLQSRDQIHHIRIDGYIVTFFFIPCHKPVRRQFLKSSVTSPFSQHPPTPPQSINPFRYRKARMKERRNRSPATDTPSYQISEYIGFKGAITAYLSKRQRSVTESLPKKSQTCQ